MIRTRVGYAGGRTPNPTYRDIGGHAEALQIDYDPSRIRYEDLLELFWRSHSPTRERGDSQYRSMIFASEGQLERARSSHAAAEQREQRRLYTQIVPLERFTRAEDYHQKYYLGRVRGLQSQLIARFPSFEDFVDSTAVARLNGYAGGHRGRRDLERERAELGLDEAGYSALAQLL